MGKTTGERVVEEDQGDHQLDALADVVGRVVAACWGTSLADLKGLTLDADATISDAASGPTAVMQRCAPEDQWGRIHTPHVFTASRLWQRRRGTVRVSA
jgi:hypothetical protein